MRRIVTAVLSAALFGCVGNFQRIPDAGFDPNRFEVVGEAQSSSSGGLLLSVIPIGMTDHLERATQRALEQLNGDALVNVRVQERWYWAYVWTGYGIRLNATVLREKREGR